MTAVLKVNVQEIDTKFVEDLKHQFGHSELEIRVHDQPDAASMFTAKDFWETIGLLNWSSESDYTKVVEPRFAHWKVNHWPISIGSLIFYQRNYGIWILKAMRRFS